jgi:hypothetical protein
LDQECGAFVRLASKPVPFVVSPNTPTPFAVARPYTAEPFPPV